MEQNCTEPEDRLMVEAYFEMLASELKGEAYNKMAIRRSVFPHLNNRSHGSLELKNQNISAVLIQLGYPFIDGHKPRSNFQALLAERVDSSLRNRLEPAHTLLRVAGTEEPMQLRFFSILDDQPTICESKHDTICS